MLLTTSHIMTKLIWVDNLLLFKITNTYSTQQLCISSKDYIEELDMTIGDIVFLRDKYKPQSYARLGKLVAMTETNKVIIQTMPNIGTFSKSKIEKIHLSNM